MYMKKARTKKRKVWSLEYDVTLTRETIVHDPATKHHDLISSILPENVNCYDLDAADSALHNTILFS